MQIPITQPPEDIAGDLVFTQPKFYFGQILEDEKRSKGFVIGMDFDGEWHYTLFYPQFLVVSKRIVENKLAIATTEVVAMSDSLAMLPPQFVAEDEG